jgi:hypothetical protein
MNQKRREPSERLRAAISRIVGHEIERSDEYDPDQAEAWEAVAERLERIEAQLSHDENAR